MSGDSHKSAGEPRVVTPAFTPGCGWRSAYGQVRRAADVFLA